MPRSFSRKLGRSLGLDPSSMQMLVCASCQYCSCSLSCDLRASHLARQPLWVPLNRSPECQEQPSLTAGPPGHRSVCGDRHPGAGEQQRGWVITRPLLSPHELSTRHAGLSVLPDPMFPCACHLSMAWWHSSTNTPFGTSFLSPSWHHWQQAGSCPQTGRRGSLQYSTQDHRGDGHTSSPQEMLGQGWPCSCCDSKNCQAWLRCCQSPWAQVPQLQEDIPCCHLPQLLLQDQCLPSSAPVTPAQAAPNPASTTCSGAWSTQRRHATTHGGGGVVMALPCTPSTLAPSSLHPRRCSLPQA